MYCFEKPGVLADENEDNSVIEKITEQTYPELVQNGTVKGGMLPKLQNAFDALKGGVTEVIITKADNVKNLSLGTHIVL